MLIFGTTPWCGPRFGKCDSRGFLLEEHQNLATAENEKDVSPKGRIIAIAIWLLQYLVYRQRCQQRDLCWSSLFSCNITGRHLLNIFRAHAIYNASGNGSYLNIRITDLGNDRESVGTKY
jgi:hypothetical protein